MIRNTSLLCMLLMGLTGPAWGAGYTTADTSVTAMGTGGTGTARKHDAAAAYKNPAATLFAPAMKMSLGTVFAAPHMVATSGNLESQTESALSVPPHAHFSYATEDFALGKAKIATSNHKHKESKRQ